MVTRSQTAVSLERVLQRAALFFLALYLVMMGGKYIGLVLFIPYQINVLLIVFGGLAWILWRALRRRPFPATPFDLPLLFFLAVFFLASLASEDPRLSMEQFVYYLVCVLIFYLMVDLDRAGKPVETWVGLTLVGGIWFLAFGLAELVGWWLRWLEIGGIAQPIPPATIRVDATMGHANVLAAYLNMLWPLAAARLVAARSSLKKLFWGFYIAISFILIFFTSSRGGWLGSAAALAVLILLLAIDQRAQVQRAWGWLRKRAWAMVGLTLAGVVVLGLGSALLLRQSQHPSHPSGNPRSYIWNVAIDMARQRPFLGTGPGTYPNHFLEEYSIPPNVILGHAHNFLINQLGETGVIGISSLLLLCWVFMKVAITNWKLGTPGQRSRITGSFAVLAGLSVHSLFDVLQIIPLITLLVAALAAQFISDVNPQNKRSLMFNKIALPVGWVVSMGLSLFSLWGYSAYHQGIEAVKREDWPSSVKFFDEAINRDPALAVYWLRAGDAYAHIGLDDAGQMRDASAVAKAIERMERGLTFGSKYAPDWAALGKLKWSAGDQTGGITAMQHAADLAPEWGEMKLMLGQYLELDGQIGQAASLYSTGLTLNPALVESNLPPNLTVWNTVLAAFPSNSEPNDGLKALNESDYNLAEEYFRTQLGVNNANAYLGFGLALQGQAKFPEAEKALRISQFIDDNQVRVYEALATLYAQMGDMAKSAKETERKNDILKHNSKTTPDNLGISRGDLSIIYFRE